VIRVPECYRGLAKAAAAQGWQITLTGSGHLRWTSPAGRSVFTPQSPSSRGGPGILRVKGKLKRAGLEI